MAKGRKSQKARRNPPVSNKKGRRLETLVARFESFLGGPAVAVKSPDHIMDAVAQVPREVDVSLRTQCGSADRLVVIECRDRKGAQDLRWIEELRTKKEDIGANECVAVSTRGFTPAAISKARHHRVSLRWVEDVSDAGLRNQFDNLQFTVRLGAFALPQIHIGFEGERKLGAVDFAEDLRAAFVADSYTAAVFFDREENRWFSAQDFVEEWEAREGPLDRKGYPFGEKQEIPLEVRPTPCLMTRTNIGPMDVSYIRLGLEFTPLQYHVTPAAHCQYRDEIGPRAYASRAPFAVDGRPCCTFTVVRRTSDRLEMISVEPDDLEFFGKGKFVPVETSP